MESCHSNLEFSALCFYNEVLATFLKEFSIQRSNRQLLESQVDQKVQEIKQDFPQIFQVTKLEISEADILSHSNIFEILLYFALNSQWDAIKLAEPQNLLNLMHLGTFLSNLEHFLTQEFYNTLLDQNQTEELRSLLRTLALYFYIRAPDACFLDCSVTFENAPYWQLKTISNSKQEFINFFYGLKSYNIVKDAFSNLFDGILIDSLFDHVCNYSFYAPFSFEHFGLTGIGGYIFLPNIFDRLAHLYEAANLIFLLRQSAQLARGLKQGQKICFEIFSQKKYNYETGFETLLFGKRLNYINDASADFLMNNANWELNKEEFQNRLKQSYDQGKIDGFEKLNVGKSHGSKLNVGRCGMSVRLRSKMMIKDAYNSSNS